MIPVVVVVVVIVGGEELLSPCMIPMKDHVWFKSPCMPPPRSHPILIS